MTQVHTSQETMNLEGHFDEFYNNCLITIQKINTEKINISFTSILCTLIFFLNHCSITYNFDIMEFQIKIMIAIIFVSILLNKKIPHLNHLQTFDLKYLNISRQNSNIFFLKRLLSLINISYLKTQDNWIFFKGFVFLLKPIYEFHQDLV